MSNLIMVVTNSQSITVTKFIDLTNLRELSEVTDGRLRQYDFTKENSPWVCVGAGQVGHVNTGVIDYLNFRIEGNGSVTDKELYNLVQEGVIKSLKPYHEPIVYRYVMYRPNTEGNPSESEVVLASLAHI